MGSSPHPVPGGVSLSKVKVDRVGSVCRLIRADGKQNRPELVVLTCKFSVELPGIEPATKNGVTCGNAEFDYAKRRETTCGYTGGVDGVNRSEGPLAW